MKYSLNTKKEKDTIYKMNIIDNKIKQSSLLKTFLPKTINEPTIVVKRNSNYESFVIDNLVLRELKNIDIDSATLLIAFPDKTHTAILTSMYLCELLKLPLIGDITSLRPTLPYIAVINDGLPSHLIRVYGDKRIIIITTELSFKEGAEAVIQNIFKHILSFTKRHKIGNIFSIIGTISDTENKRENNKDFKYKFCENRINFVTTSQSISEKLINSGIYPFKTIVVKGISGLLIAEAPFMGTSEPNITIIGGSEKIKEKSEINAICAITALSILLPELKLKAFENSDKIKKIYRRIMGYNKESDDKPPCGMYS